MGTGFVLQGEPSQVAVGSLDGIYTAAVDEGSTGHWRVHIRKVPGNKGSPQAATAEHAQQNSSYNDRPPETRVEVEDVTTIEMEEDQSRKTEAESSHFCACQDLGPLARQHTHDPQLGRLGTD